VLRGTAPSVNIRERRDYSCAVFDEAGRLVSQAAHIPVHLGSASLSVEAVRERFPDLEPGDAVLLNDPFAGGTHLPDLTLVTPVHGHSGGRPWFVVNRAHHSDIGGSQPGSMAPATDLTAEGLRIPPVKLIAAKSWVPDVLSLVLANTRTPALREGDLRAQVAANSLGATRLAELWGRYGRELCGRAATELHAYTSRLVDASLRELRRGRYRVTETLEGDGTRDDDMVLRLTLEVGPTLCFDFTDTDDQCPGSMNANPAVVRAAVLYTICCLVPDEVPTNDGLLHRVRIETRPGSLVDPYFPAPVAGGNVETSQRLVDLCLAALGRAGGAVPAQSSGTMNNLSFGGVDAGGSSFAFYETIGGGAGANADGDGASGVQTHMTNTRNTSVEELERSLPIRIEAYTLRRGSGGRGRHRGGDGIEKEMRALQAMQVSLLSERRRHPPAGAEGGQPGKPGEQSVADANGRRRAVPTKGSFVLRAGEVLRIRTPGGGGFGPPMSHRVIRSARRGTSSGRRPAAAPDRGP